MLTFYCTTVFGVMEFGQIFYRRIDLTNSCREAVRRASVGKPLAEVRAAARSAASLPISDSQVIVEYNSKSDDTGDWIAAADDASGTGNTIPVGHLCRVRIVQWPHPLLTGTYFSFVPGVKSGSFSMSAHDAMLRE